MLAITREAIRAPVAECTNEGRLFSLQTKSLPEGSPHLHVAFFCDDDHYKLASSGCRLTDSQQLAPSCHGTLHPRGGVHPHSTHTQCKNVRTSTGHCFTQLIDAFGLGRFVMERSQTEHSVIQHWKVVLGLARTQSSIDWQSTREMLPLAMTPATFVSTCGSSECSSG